ncbi:MULTISPECIES: GFA family protein [unclassified Microcystis]|uniref:GFA family protein n=1 Tax=unclassified Microcystis TaxID=2643300 RepID=UPI0022CA8F69|nr:MULTISPECIES: GFA family protein [unclassified Microcystis]MCA2751198.1 GFA family protein [Microcystis sp. M144S2]MCZ8125793.1 GFA family protein [Microcystis sp. LE19-114.1B]MCZ8201794.1 GFA family protein [Microcystis sp. LE19-55.1A]MCZ8305759.1 GFA family protein [Microcystis sp. LE19-98.1E]
MRVAGSPLGERKPALLFSSLEVMTATTQGKIYGGGCHCGAIRFQVAIEHDQALDCNCSICQKKGFLHLIVPSAQFTLLSGEDFLSTYTFNTHTAQHYFCRVCGIHPFYRPRSHPDAIDINLRCLDGNVLGDFQIQFFDGANWEDNIEKIRDIDGKRE